MTKRWCERPRVAVEAPLHPLLTFKWWLQSSFHLIIILKSRICLKFEMRMVANHWFINVMLLIVRSCDLFANVRWSVESNIWVHPHMAATMYRVSRSTEDIQCSVLYRSTGPGRFLPGSLYVVYIYTLDIQCIVLDGSTGPARGHRCRLYESGTRMRAPSGTSLGAYFWVLWIPMVGNWTISII